MVFKNCRRFTDCARAHVRARQNKTMPWVWDAPPTQAYIHTTAQPDMHTIHHYCGPPLHLSKTPANQTQSAMAPWLLTQLTPPAEQQAAPQPTAEAAGAVLPGCCAVTYKNLDTCTCNAAAAAGPLSLLCVTQASSARPAQTALRKYAHRQQPTTHQQKLQARTRPHRVGRLAAQPSPLSAHGREHPGVRTLLDTDLTSSCWAAVVHTPPLGFVAAIDCPPDAAEQGC